LKCGSGSRLISICGTSGGIEPAMQNKITQGRIVWGNHSGRTV
jgi:hypothetical protein